jgi:hypothetical protein
MAKKGFSKWFSDPIYRAGNKSSSYFKSFNSWGDDWDSYWLRDDMYDPSDEYGSTGITTPKKPDKTLVCEEALRTIGRSANAILNSGDENERKLTVKFSNNENINTVRSDVIYLSPDKLVDTEDKNDRYEIMDALCGQSMLSAQIRRQVSAESYDEFIKSKDDDVRSLWSAIELAIARSDIISDWGGFKPYFDNYAQYSSKVSSTTIKRELSKHNGSSPEKPTSSSALIKGLAWNLYHSHDPVKIPPVYADGKRIVAEGLSEADTSQKRWEHCSRVVNELRKLYDTSSPPPPSPTGPGEGPINEDLEDLTSLLEIAVNTDKDQEKQPKPERKRGADKFSGIDEELFGTKSVDNKKFKGAAELASISGTSLSEEKELALAPAYRPEGRSCRTVNVAHNFWVPKDKPTKSSLRHFNQVVGELNKSAEILRDSFGFTDRQPVRRVFGMRAGVLHPASLYKVNLENDEVFYKKSVHEVEKVSVCILVDQSGSMGCDSGDGKMKVTEAAEVAYVLAKLCKDIKQLDLCVLGFSAQEGSSESYKKFGSRGNDNEVNMRLIYDNADPVHNDISSICHIAHHANNLDGFSIWYAAKYMSETRQESKRKIVIVISDGSPNGRGYEGNAAEEHVNTCRKDAKNRFGVDIYAIGIANAYSQYEGDKMYGAGRNIVIKDVKSSLGYLSRFLNQVSQL